MRGCDKILNCERASLESETVSIMSGCEVIGELTRKMVDTEAMSYEYYKGYNCTKDRIRIEWVGLYATLNQLEKSGKYGV